MFQIPEAVHVPVQFEQGCENGPMRASVFAGHVG